MIKFALERYRQVFAIGLIMQAGWMIDFAKFGTVVLPFFVVNLYLPGYVWFFLAEAEWLSGINTSGYRWLAVFPFMEAILFFHGMPLRLYGIYWNDIFYGGLVAYAAFVAKYDLLPAYRAFSLKE